MAPLVEAFPEDLDRSLLHVFVFGAGVGEAIAVALPARGWLLIDGSRLVAGDEELHPALEAYTALGDGDDDPIELLLWTHPHADHYQGVREAIERHRPRRVGMTLVESPPPGSAARELAALGGHPALPDDLRLQDVFKQVKSTLERVFHYWREEPASRLLLSAQSPAIDLGATRIRAFSPDRDSLRQFYSQGLDRLQVALRNRANEFSIVLGLEFGRTRIVLGGDLPHRSPDGAILPHGWQRVAQDAPELAEHSSFKISHHGSFEAIPPSFTHRAAPREWVATPFAREHLPRPHDDARGGLRELLQRVPAVRLTSSVGLVAPTEPGARVLRDQLRVRLAALEADGFVRGLRAPAAAGAFDFAWAVAFDDAGSARRLFAGRQAITVVERAER